MDFFPSLIFLCFIMVNGLIILKHMKQNLKKEKKKKDPSSR